MLCLVGMEHAVLFVADQFTTRFKRKRETILIPINRDNRYWEFYLSDGSNEMTK